MYLTSVAEDLFDPFCRSVAALLSPTFPFLQGLILITFVFCCLRFVTQPLKWSTGYGSLLPLANSVVVTPPRFKDYCDSLCKECYLEGD